ncbi:hypothetical protein M569_11430, partial [Genlisea aurea]
FLSSLFFLSLSTFSSVVALLRAPELPSLSAEKLIRGLNLFPDRLINVVEGGGYSATEAPGIVERRFKFPNLVNPNGVTDDDLGHHAGYYKIEHSHGARMFYFLFESRNSSSDPVVIWLTGGPGCGSEMALFYENGPFTIDDNLSLVWNEYGWDQVSNILFVDQPIGTGFSYTSDRRDIRHYEKDISDDLYDFIQ